MERLFHFTDNSEGSDHMSESEFTHDYYYGGEAGQYTFYRLPKALFTEGRYKNLSDGAKILYGLMLDRMGLSAKNGWLDDENRVYIFFTLDEVKKYMNCEHGKAVKLFSELDTTGSGLIERVRQGQGRPSMIYVKKFYERTEPLPFPTPPKPPANDTSGLDVTSEKRKSEPLSKESEVKTSQKRKSALPKIERQDFRKSAGNKTEKNKTENIQTENLYIDPASKPLIIRFARAGGFGTDGMDEIESLRERIRQNIGYDVLIGQFGIERMDGVVEVMAEAVCSARPALRIGGVEYPREEIKNRLLSIRSLEIQYVFECMDENAAQIRNIKAYLLASLFNAPVTMDAYYRAKVNTLIFGGG
jgi:hypothetical protein